MVGTWQRRIRRLTVTKSMRVVWVILALLLALRICLPFTVEWYINKRLDASSVYEGSIGNVDLHLYRGAYSVEEVTIAKIDGAVPVPLFSSDRVEFSLLWRALLNRAVVASIHFEYPNINIVDSRNDANKQTGREGKWLSLLNDLVPLRIDEISATNASLHFRNFEVAQPVDVYITNLSLRATNLTNSENLADSMVGRITGAGQVADAGDLEFELMFDPTSDYPTFDLDGRVTEIPLEALDDLIIAYAPFDVEAGEVSLTTELAALDGEVKGYIKPLITDLKVFSWHADVLEDHDNPLVLLWEGLVGVVGELFQNQAQDQLATVVEINGRFDSLETDRWTTFVNILRNAFIEALTLDYEGTVSLDLLRDTPAEAGDSAAPDGGASGSTPAPASRGPDNTER